MTDTAQFTLFRPSETDIPALAALGADTFAESHGDQYAPADLEAFVSQVFEPAAVRGEWVDPRYAFQVAQSEDRFIGYCKLGPASGDFDCDLELKQIFVRREHYGTPVGAALMAWAKQEAASRDVETLGLSVWEGNARAIRFYEKHGFERTGTVSFQVGDKVETDVTFACRVNETG